LMMMAKRDRRNNYIILNKSAELVEDSHSDEFNEIPLSDDDL
jgi:hypothetical protein